MSLILGLMCIFESPPIFWKRHYDPSQSPPRWMFGAFFEKDITNDQTVAPAESLDYIKP